MTNIHILSPQIANMIAAGEVVERPASVVKELVENAIDAAATVIEIKIKQAGRGAILIEDNGNGMEKEDAILAFTRHATSKINSKNDLFKIATLGFRGEALPSISSVSKVTLTTSNGKNEGTTLTMMHNKLADIKVSPSKKGTSILVENLFYNTPARLKHLKSDTTELAHIVAIINKLAMGYPHIVFRLYHHDNLLFHTSGRGDLLEVIAQIYGADFAKDLTPVSFEDQDFKVTGYVGKNYVSRPSRKYIQCLLNNRPIRLPMLYSVLQQVYHPLIPSDRFPIAILHIAADYQLVDINVHPSKNEVRLSKDDALTLLLKEGLKQALFTKASFPQINLESKEIQSAPLIFKQPSLPLEAGHQFVEKEPLWLQENAAPYTTTTTPLLKQLRAVGQVHGTYIVAQSEDGFYLVDQHAAVERVQYETLSALYEKDISTSALLIPYIIELSYHDIVRLKDKLDVFGQLGMGVELFGNNALRITSLPTWIKKEDVHEYIAALIEAIFQGNDSFFYLRSHSIATLACRSSLKSNQYLTLEAMQSLLDALMACKNPHNCPHGRPTMLFYSTYELEKLFKRTGF